MNRYAGFIGLLLLGAALGRYVAMREPATEGKITAQFAKQEKTEPSVIQPVSPVAMEGCDEDAILLYGDDKPTDWPDTEKVDKNADMMANALADARKTHRQVCVVGYHYYYAPLILHGERVTAPRGPNGEWLGHLMPVMPYAIELHGNTELSNIEISTIVKKAGILCVEGPHNRISDLSILVDGQ